MYKFIVALFLVLSLCSCERINRYFNMKDDNVFEEAVESVIKSQTGADVDLTPSSPEIKVIR